MSRKKEDLVHGGDPSCGCCEGISELTPIAVANRPGLDALSYRVGTHGTFLQTMLARLSRLRLDVMPESGDEVRKLYPLRDLTTRSTDDPSIALLDAWATLADVLTFYQERIANEGYLRTALERRSLVELARLVGYAPRPGVAASVYLAFTVDDNYEEVEIPVATRAQSVPEDGGEMPQFFETGAPLVARSEWNDLGVRRVRPQEVDVPKTADPFTLYFAGTSTNLKPNDPLCVSALGQVLRVTEITPDPETARTAVEVQLWRPPTPEVAMEVGASPEPEPPKPAAVAAEIERLVDDFHDLGAYHEVTPGATAERLDGMLEELRQEVSPELPMTELIRLVNEAVAKLDDEHTTAHDRGWSNIEMWTADMRAELRERRNAWAAGASGTFAGVEEDPPSVRANILSAVVDGLGKPPSVQPPNSQRLPRSVERAFAAEAQLGLNLLTTFQPRIRQTLYAAWENAPVTKPPIVESVEALRVKAAPFGATAPLKPVFDQETGAVVGYEEWLLPETMRIEVAMSKATQTEVSIKLNRRGDEFTGRHVFVAEDGAELVVGPLNVHLARLDGEISLLLDLDPPIWVSANFSFRTEEESTVRVGRQDTFVDIHNIHELPGVEASVVRRPSSSIPLNPIEINIEVGDSTNVLPLDAQYDQILPGTCVVIDRGDTGLLVREVIAARTLSKAAYGITGKVTELTLNDDWLSNGDPTVAAIRNTAVYAQGEELELSAAPIDPVADPVAGKDIELDGLYPGLEPGRWLIVSGERTDVPGTEGVRASELAMIAEVTQGIAKVTQEIDEDLPGDTNHTFLELAAELAYEYKRDTVTIHANVVEATHGESRSQVLGSGDGSRSGQSFDLAFKPLTHVAAPTPEGAESTLEVRVNEVLWHQAANPAALGPNDRSYTTRTDAEDTTTVVFGDGVRGARLPTGVENVTGEYRQGIGKAGNVEAEQISLLATQPLGVKGVSNPLAASGGADRDSRHAIRRNAPLEVTALDRLVSVQDYADFARTFAGVARASATLLSDGLRRLVHVTVAGVDDIPIAETSELLRNLREALRRFGDPHQPFEVEVRELLLLVISARVRIAPDYRWESVEPAVRSALLETFGFARRELGQDVVSSEAISTIQRVRGVASVDIDVLDRVAENVTPEELEQLAKTLIFRQRVPVELARVETRSGVECRPVRTILPAQIAYLSPDLPDTLILTEWTR